MKKIIAFATLVALVAGCATKNRDVELNGMYVSESGTLAIGSVEVVASPIGENSVSIKYSEDTAWLSPSTKTHNIKIFMNGTNSVEQASDVVSYICEAFVRTAEHSNTSTNEVVSAGVTPAEASSTILSSATNVLTTATSADQAE